MKSKCYDTEKLAELRELRIDHFFTYLLGCKPVILEKGKKDFVINNLVSYVHIYFNRANKHLKGGNKWVGIEDLIRCSKK
ncbi:unnamed protein product [Rhizophagus irregularis]|nr:unnamed protein product [Rhizophagus irregularis]